MITRLATAALLRRRARTALTIAGVAVAAAMLLDMVMLGSGMRESFRGFIDQQGFQLRLTPRGTMPCLLARRSIISRAGCRTMTARSREHLRRPLEYVL